MISESNWFIHSMYNAQYLVTLGTVVCIPCGVRVCSAGAGEDEYECNVSPVCLMRDFPCGRLSRISGMCCKVAGY